MIGVGLVVGSLLYWIGWMVGRRQGKMEGWIAGATATMNTVKEALAELGYSAPLEEGNGESY